MTTTERDLTPFRARCESERRRRAGWNQLAIWLTRLTGWLLVVGVIDWAMGQK